MRALFILSLLSLCISACTQKQRPSFEGLVPINGTELYIKAFGTGDPLLIIHGGPGLSHDYFLPHFEELAKTNFLIFYDQRGAGLSSMQQDSSQMNLQTFVEDIDAIRTHLKLDKMSILAHSWGSLLAVEYALTHGSKVDKLILSNPVPLSQEYNAEIAEAQGKLITENYTKKRQEIISSEAFQNQEVKAYEDIFLLNFSLSFKDTLKLNGLNLNFQDTFLSGNRLLRYFKGLENYNYYEGLDELNNPTLIIRGAYDLTSRTADERTAGSVQNGSIIEFDNSGHFPFIEEPLLYTQQIQNFLSGYK